MNRPRRPKRRKGDLFAAVVLGAPRLRDAVQVCARCGLALCDCRDADWRVGER